jgi:hypothetical protein
MAFTVVLDARRVRDFGIGSYIRNLVRALAAVDAENRYVLVALPEGVEEFADLPANFRTVRFARPDTGLIHQISFSLFLRQFDADLFHLPLNVVPWGMPRPYVVTVHDLSSLLFPPAPDRWRALRLWRNRAGPDAGSAGVGGFGSDAAGRGARVGHPAPADSPDLRRARSAFLAGRGAAVRGGGSRAPARAGTLPGE